MDDDEIRWFNKTLYCTYIMAMVVIVLDAFFWRP